MLHNFPSALELTPSILFILFVCSLFSLTAPTIVFLVAVKKCAMPLSEPLVDHRPLREMVEEVDVTRGPKGYRHMKVRQNPLDDKFIFTFKLTWVFWARFGQYFIRL